MTSIQTTPPILNIPASGAIGDPALAGLLTVLTQSLNNWAVQLLNYLYPLAPTVTVANLPTNAKAGTIFQVSDGAAGLVLGAVVSGGGSTKYLVYWNGTSWLVIGGPPVAVLLPAPAFTVATLPVSPATGSFAYVTDGAVGLAWGSNIAGGSTVKYLVWYNGANWTVVGK